jgi:hypothetical protein
LRKNLIQFAWRWKRQWPFGALGKVRELGLLG